MRLDGWIPAVFFVALFALPLATSGAESGAQASAASQVTDTSEIRAFVRSRPTPEEFREAYPEVWLILPGDIVSREVCSEYYRFVAELDPDGRIRGGHLE
ncbi:hypothetical protein [Thioalkalivibrio sp.]|uniref:hypothetical protein n=1 Tax=Thioalkalivibrio sp. TaxID=2093813 RepID=UPI003568ED22